MHILTHLSQFLIVLFLELIDRPEVVECVYTEYAGCAITTTIPVKNGTAHGRSRPEVGSTKRIDVYGRKGVNPAPPIFRYF